jgi:hypothetical protein
MKILKCFLIFFAICVVQHSLIGQSNFSVNNYKQFLSDNKNLGSEDLLACYAPENDYYKGNETGISSDEFSYLDSVSIKYNLTESELHLLQKNHFVVSERLNYMSFGFALHDIYTKDLPVFLTTDAVLQALHASYDKILMDIEIAILEPQLSQFLESLYNSYPLLLTKYQANPHLLAGLRDVDLYVTIARSLLSDNQLSPQFTNADDIQVVWDAIQSEQLKVMPLFSEKKRKLDFSQFTVRGHYTRAFYDQSGRRTLGPYFKSMMWLGRIDFLLTPPPDNPWESPWTKEDIRRMNLGATLLNELIDISETRYLLNSNDEVITFMVGECDNLTPTELSEVVDSLNINSAAALLDDPTYNAFQTALTSSGNSGQQILSNFFLMDPFSTEPDTLPVSFRLMGQRFIIDSYVFSNVVYDRIIYNGHKIWRPMPDPLDAMFVLGNDDALPLLRDELDTYKYSSQLAALRYLVDSYDTNFWETSLYNVWLNSLRCLNPSADQTEFPFFMKTVAWHQEKLNSQLASWAQLRHDNLLYAKQSYTGGTGCSFPHSYIEPYPEFYGQIAKFADKALQYFSEFPETNRVISDIKNYFPKLQNVMQTLETLAQKELNDEPFSYEEIEFLKTMLFVDGGSGEPPFSGWYADLYYSRDDAAKPDYIVADVHTQPTDFSGNVVGKVLHVGVGQINLGVFLAESPTFNYQPMCFVGPVMSYYEKITENFDRLTDERWTELVETENLPARPDWVNIYLADNSGNKMESGRELPGKIYTGIKGGSELIPKEYLIIQNYPNPFNPSTTINYEVPQSEHIQIQIYDIRGRIIETLVNQEQSSGKYGIQWDASAVPSGLYFCKINAGKFEQTIKMMLVR